MLTVTVDSALKNTLSAIRNTTTFMDADGNVLGTYFPKTETEDDLYARSAKLFDPAELERRIREQHGQGVTFDEVMKRLNALETAG